MITIRPMEANDIDQCAGIIASMMPWVRYGLTLEIATARLSTGLQQNAKIFIADGGNGNILGLVWVVERGAFDLSGYIRWIAVRAEHRGSGIGVQLLSAAEEHARKIGRDIFLLCSDFNVDAQQFYTRHGYVQVGAMPDYVLPGVIELLYRKRLV